MRPKSLGVSTSQRPVELLLEIICRQVGALAGRPLGGGEVQNGSDGWREGGTVFRLRNVGYGQAEPANQMAPAMGLLEFECQRDAARMAERLLEHEHGPVRFADLRVDAPCGCRVAIDGMGNRPTLLVKVGPGPL